MLGGNYMDASASYYQRKASRTAAAVLKGDSIAQLQNSKRGDFRLGVGGGYTF